MGLNKEKAKKSPKIVQDKHQKAEIVLELSHSEGAARWPDK